MAGWTKADYDAAYRSTAQWYIGGIPQGENPVYLRYNAYRMRMLWQGRYQKIAPQIPVTSADYVCVFGCGFGWGVEQLIAQTGCTAVGVDISDYIAAEIGNTEEVDLRQAIIDAGLDPNTGRGAFILSEVFDNNPRSVITFLQTDGATVNERQQIRAALGGNWPTICVMEDMVDDSWTDTDIINARNAAGGFGGSQTVVWIYSGTDARSLQDLATLTGNDVYSGSGVKVTP